MGGLGIDEVQKRSEYEYNASRKFTEKLVENIKKQDSTTRDLKQHHQEIKAEIRRQRRENNEKNLQEILSMMSPKDQRQHEITTDGLSNWLTSLPLEEFNFNLNKREFWDSLRLRYNWPIPNMPLHCACGSSFDVHHALTCKKGGFVIRRHNEIRDITAKLLSEVTKDVEVEPELIALTGEEMHHATSKTNNEVRLDIAARDFWVKGQRSYFDVRVFDPNAKKHQHLQLKRCYQLNENEKKRHYNERIQRVDQGSFSPLVFSLAGGMAPEARVFYGRLSEKLALKRNVETNIIKSWIKTLLNFSLIRSMLLMIRGSRSIVKKNDLVDETIAEVTRRGC